MVRGRRPLRAVAASWHSPRVETDRPALQRWRSVAFLRTAPAPARRSGGRGLRVRAVLGGRGCARPPARLGPVARPVSSSVSARFKSHSLARPARGSGAAASASLRETGRAAAAGVQAEAAPLCPRIAEFAAPRAPGHDDPARPRAAPGSIAPIGGQGGLPLAGCAGEGSGGGQELRAPGPARQAAPAGLVRTTSRDRHMTNFSRAGLR